MTDTIFVGLGRMGRPMAGHVASRFAIGVHDVVPAVVDAVAAETGAEAVHDLSAVEDVRTVLLMLPTSAHVEGILLHDGLLERMQEGGLVVDMGSSRPESTRLLAERAAAAGVRYVDAPVSGGVAKAQTGELAMLVGGDALAIDAARPYLDAVGSTIVTVGGSGTGHAAKAINNLVSATNIAVAVEAVLHARAAGIAPERMIAVLNSSTGMSQASSVKLPGHILPETYASGFAYDLMLKDLGIAMELDVDHDSTPLTTAAYALLRDGRSLLGDAPDHTEIARVYERRFHAHLKEDA